MGIKIILFIQIITITLFSSCINTGSSSSSDIAIEDVDKSIEMFPALRVASYGLEYSEEGDFSDAKRTNLVGAVLPNNMYGYNPEPYEKMVDGELKHDFHDLFWTNLSKNSDPKATIDSILNDVKNANMNSIRIILHYCEWGGGLIDGNNLGCSTSSNVPDGLSELLKYFTEKASKEKIIVVVDLFNYFSAWDNDDVAGNLSLNYSWLDNIFTILKDSRNVIFAVQNEPGAHIANAVSSENWSAEFSRISSWYDLIATYIKSHDIDSSNMPRHLVGLVDIVPGALEFLDLEKYDILFMHHAGRETSFSGAIESVLGKLVNKDLKKSIIFDEVSCVDCSSSSSEIYYNDVRKTYNSRISKLYSGNAFNGLMAWTLYDSFEGRTSHGDSIREWGIYSSIGSERSELVDIFEGFESLTSFSSYDTPESNPFILETLVSDYYLWDSYYYNSVSNSGQWNWGGDGTSTMNITETNNVLSLNYTRSGVCSGERYTGDITLPLLDSGQDMIVSYTLLNSNDEEGPLVSGSRGNKFVLGLKNYNWTGWQWGGQVKKLHYDEIHGGKFSINLSQVLRDEGIQDDNGDPNGDTDGPTIGIVFILAEKDGDGCAQSGDGTSTVKLKDFKLKVYNTGN